MKVELLHVRDPDGECYTTVFVDGEIVEHAEHGVDAGRGSRREDWDENTEWFKSEAEKAGYTQPFIDAVVVAREDPPGRQYIED